MVRRRSREDDDRTHLDTIRELVDWARSGFGPCLTPDRRHGLYLLGTADRAVAEGRLAAWEHFLFLAALCERRDVGLASRLLDALAASALRAEVHGSPAGDAQRAYRQAFARLCAAPETASLGSRVAAWRHELRTRELQAERERRRMERRQARSRFEAAVREIVADVQAHHPVAHTPPPLELADLHLVLAWTLRTDLETASRAATDVGTALDRYGARADFQRNLSARAAERAAAAMYTLLYPNAVRDVAGDMEAADWKTHDLLAGGRPVDVKNVRHWRDRGYPREEARVTAFKRTRDGLPVVVAGTRSPALPSSAFFHRGPGGDGAVTYLGETGEAAIEALERMFEGRHLQVDFRRPGSAGERFLPHWVFDLPAGVYRRRARAVAGTTRELFADPWFWSDARAHPLAVALLAGMDVTDAPAAAHVPAWQRAFFRTLLARRTGSGSEGRMSLPVLHLSLLEHFLEAACDSGAVAGFTPDGYRDVLFFDGEPVHGAWPAGVYDPAGTVAGLIAALAVLWRGRARLVGLRQFRLRGRGILEGRAEPGRPWTTLVAYCGDCAHAPLVLGSHDPCPHCRKLVCRACGFCSAPSAGGGSATGSASCRGGPRRPR